MIIDIPKILSKEITDKYNFVGNTFIDKDKKEVHNKFEIEIGDLKQDNFQPQLKIKRWDNECNFSCRLIDDEPDIPEIKTEGNKIKFIKNKLEVHLFDSKIGEEKEIGAYEFEVILKEKPATNEIKMSMETKKLVFYYQSEISDKEAQKLLDKYNEQKKKGKPKRSTSEQWQEFLEKAPTTLLETKRIIRPENAVGSYAVYHESKQGDYSKIGGNNYLNGKASHIYRPKVVDSAGKEVWGKLSIDIEKKLLIVKVPQKFLDNAIYPVIVDPTFGCDPSATPTAYDAADNQIRGALFTSPASVGPAEKFTIYCKYDFFTDHMKGVLVLNSNLHIVTNGVSNAFSPPKDSTWTDTFFATSPSLSPNTGYVLAVIGDTCWTSVGRDDGDVDQGLFDSDNNYDSPTDPIDVTHNNNRYFVYCTYTVGPGVPTVTTQAATDITQNSAIGHGNITDTGGENCDKRGIVYSKVSRGDPGNIAPADSDYEDYEEEDGDFGTGAFTRSLTGLDASTKYYARAYAHNSAGYSYGAEIDFTTSALSVSPNLTSRKNYNGYLAFVQQFFKHRLNDTTPWSHPDGYLIS